MTAKEFSVKNNMPLCTVKRYCKNGTFRYQRIGRKYSIDVDYALKALTDLDEQQQILNTPIKRTPPRRNISAIKTEADYLEALRQMRKDIA